MNDARDHGGALDAAVARFGGPRSHWIDLSTGINPNPYPLPEVTPDDWASLPDPARIQKLEAAAAHFWSVPEGWQVVAAGGASAIIAALPSILTGTSVSIPEPTYNEHWAAFRASGWRKSQQNPHVQVVVHPNNPDGKLWSPPELNASQTVVDESFCDICRDESLLLSEQRPDRVIILKSFGKFWGLAGLRLGFAICSPEDAQRLRNQLGPWAVSGPACTIGTQALADQDWASNTRSSLATAAERLRDLLRSTGLGHVGGTDLFHLAEVPNASEAFVHFAKAKILTRIFPYSKTWIRFGLPGAEEEWDRLKAALSDLP